MATTSTRADPPRYCVFPRELHLSILSHFSFYDAYSLRLTSHYFTSITSPLSEPYKQYVKLLFDAPPEAREKIYEEYKKSWFGRTSKMEVSMELIMYIVNLNLRRLTWHGPPLATLSPFRSCSSPANCTSPILDHLPFYDAFALRLTSRHFAGITRPFGRPYILFEQLADATPLDRREKVYEAFNTSWFAEVESMVEVSGWHCGEVGYGFFDNRHGA